MLPKKSEKIYKRLGAKNAFGNKALIDAIKEESIVVCKSCIGTGVCRKCNGKGTISLRK